MSNKDIAELIDIAFGILITLGSIFFVWLYLKLDKVHDELKEIKKERDKEIVMCKDCKHRDPEDEHCDSGHTIRWQLPRPDNFFCADGERKKTE